MYDGKFKGNILIVGKNRLWKNHFCSKFRKKQFVWRYIRGILDI